MYVAVKGGEAAIDNAHLLLAHARRGDPAVPELSVAQIAEQLTILVDRVMTEGSLYDRELAALALKQARGDVIEAIAASGLRALVHPLTDDDLADHTALAHWIGEPVELDVTVLDPPGQNQGVARFGRTDF